MGKSKKRSRSSKNRINPLGAASTKKDQNLIEKKIQPLIKNLQSTIPNDRNAAISSISVLCDDPHMRQLLLKEKLVQIILTKLLNDDNMDIVIESLGVLRNLTLEEGYDLAVHLWRLDVWSVIKLGMDKIIKSVDSMINQAANTSNDKKDDKNSKRMLFDYTDNLISLIVALSNGSDDILNDVLAESKLHEILYLLVKLIEFGFDKLPTNLQNSLLDLIYDFSSESLDFIDSIMSCEPIAQLFQNLPNLKITNQLTQILFQGIRLQFLDGVIDAKITTEDCQDIIVQVVNQINTINLAEMKDSLYNNVLDNINQQNFSSVDTTKLKDYAKAKQTAMFQLQAMEVGIDIITGIIEIIATENIKLSDQLQLQLFNQMPELFSQLLLEFPDRILIAWNNLLWLYITIEHSVSDEILINLYNKIMNDSQLDSVEIKSNKLSVISVIIKILQIQENWDLLTKLNILNNTQYTESIITEFNNVREVELRTRCINILNNVAQLPNQDLSVNKRIGEWILETINAATKNADGNNNEDENLSIENIVELTQSIFEIYANPDSFFDKTNFIDGNFLPIIRDSILPQLKNKFKFVDKNKTPELKERCTECYNILTSFVQYREKYQ